MHEVANINLATPRRSSGGVTREEKRRRLEKNARDKQPTDFCVCQVKIAKLLEMGIFFHLAELLGSWQNAIFYQVNYTKHLEMLVLCHIQFCSSLFP